MITTIQHFIHSPVDFTVDLLYQMTGVAFTASNVLPVLIGFGISAVLLVLALVMMLANRVFGRPVHDLNTASEGADHLESLAEIEGQMLALKEFYQSGRITAEVYVSESRTLYDKAQKYT